MPNTSGKVIGRLEKDNKVALLGRSSDGKWYQVKIGSRAELGWVFGETLQIITGDPTTLPVLNQDRWLANSNLHELEGPQIIRRCAVLWRLRTRRCKSREHGLTASKRKRKGIL